MNKLLFTALFYLIGLHAFCQTSIGPMGTVIVWQVKPVTPIIGGNPLPKSPVEPPMVSLDDHTLYIYDVAYDFTLMLVDENDDVAIEFGVRNIPTILFFKGGKLVDKFVGAATKATLDEKFRALL